MITVTVRGTVSVTVAVKFTAEVAVNYLFGAGHLSHRPVIGTMPTVVLLFMASPTGGRANIIRRFVQRRGVGGGV